MPIHEEGSESWILKLTNPQIKDSGEYECQVSYHEDVEKKLTMPISLTVLGKKIDSIHFIMDKIVSDFYEQKKIDLYVTCSWDQKTNSPILQCKVLQNVFKIEKRLKTFF